MKSQVVLVLLACAPIACATLRNPITTPFEDTTAVRWCADLPEGIAWYGRFSKDLDAQISAPAVAAAEPQPSSFGDRGPSVRIWQEFLWSQGITPGPVDGIHGSLTERATEEWQRVQSLRNRSIRLTDERSATPWAQKYLSSKDDVEKVRDHLLGLCNTGASNGELAPLVSIGAAALAKIAKIHEALSQPNIATPLAAIAAGPQSIPYADIQNRLERAEAEAKLILSQEE